MAEMMTLEENQSQDFYGKVVEQDGQPVPGANVTAGWLPAAISDDPPCDECGELLNLATLQDRSNILPKESWRTGLWAFPDQGIGAGLPREGSLAHRIIH